MFVDWTYFIVICNYFHVYLVSARFFNGGFDRNLWKPVGTLSRQGTPESENSKLLTGYFDKVRSPVLNHYKYPYNIRHLLETMWQFVVLTVLVIIDFQEHKAIQSYLMFNWPLLCTLQKPRTPAVVGRKEGGARYHHVTSPADLIL